jgi:outer membrane protein assembly factor BamB
MEVFNLLKIYGGTMKISLKVITIFILFTSAVFGQSVINAITAPRNASGLCWVGGYLWCGAYGTQGDTLYKINPLNGNVLKRLRWRVNADCYGLAFDTMMGGSLWVSDHSAGDSIFLIDTITGARILALRANRTYMAGLANDDQYLWHCCYYNPDGRAYHINKSTGAPFDSINIPSIPQPWGATWDGQYLWVCNDSGSSSGYQNTSSAFKIDVVTKQIIDSIRSPGIHPRGLAWDGSYLWLIANGTSPTGNVAYQIDLGGSGTPDIQIVPTTYNFGNVPIGMLPGFGLNVSNVGTDTLMIDTIFSTNPVFYYAAMSFPHVLAPGANFDASVMFNPSVFQYYTGNLGIVSNDPDEETVYVTMRGQGVYPNPVLCPSETTYSFGDVRVNCVKDWFLRIVNEGYPVLMIDTIVFTNFRFFVGRTNFPIILNCLETTYVQIITEPISSGAYAGNLQLYNNATPNPMNLHLSANGVMDIPVGGQLLWEYDFPENVVCVSQISDINNDSMLDVAAECYGTDMYGKKHLRTYWANSSGLGVTRWAVGDTGFTGSWGDDCLMRGADYNNDGVRDILLGTAWGDRSVYAINTVNGQILWFYDSHSYDGDGGWVYSVKPMPDITGDGIGEVLAGIGGNSLPTGGPRSVYCFNGATGNIIWQFRAQDGFGCVDWIPDVNNDGIPDAVAGAWGNSLDMKVYCISGANGGMLWSYQCGGDVQSVIVIPDLNGDYKWEVVCGDWSGTVKCLSGINGNPIWTSSVGGWVVKLVPIPNLVNQNRPGIAVANVSGVTMFKVLDCTNGNIMWSYPISGNIWTCDAIADLNNDSKPEVLAGNQAGMVYCFNGADGSVLWSYNAGRLIYSIRAIADISFDDKPDVLVGTQKSSSNNIAKLLAICGGSYLPGIEQEKNTNPQNSTISVFPNPFEKNAIIRYTVPCNSKVVIKLYNSIGQLVTTLKDEYQAAGSYQLNIENHKLKISKGIYFMHYQTDNKTKEVKIVIE